jgi:hypothetical protein
LQHRVQNQAGETKRVTPGMEGKEICTKQSKTPNNKNNLEYLGVDSKIILKEILTSMDHEEI